MQPKTYDCPSCGASNKNWSWVTSQVKCKACGTYLNVTWESRNHNNRDNIIVISGLFFYVAWLYISKSNEIFQEIDPGTRLSIAFTVMAIFSMFRILLKPKDCELKISEVPKDLVFEVKMSKTGINILLAFIIAIWVYVIYKMVA